MSSRALAKACMGRVRSSPSVLRSTACIAQLPATKRYQHYSRSRDYGSRYKSNYGSGPGARRQEEGWHIAAEQDLLSDPIFEETMKSNDVHSLPGQKFSQRHIGPRDRDIEEMLATLGSGVQSMDSFVNQVIPKDIMTEMEPLLPPNKKPHTETTASSQFLGLMRQVNRETAYRGQGFYPTRTPAVIERNILENPAWYTSYTPYQAEISQGRLESLLNYQTMVSDLTALPVANASLLDEGTAAAEAMALSLNCLSTARAKRPGKVFVVSDSIFATTLEVVRGRAEGLGIRIEVVDFSEPESTQTLESFGDDLIGVMVQYPDKRGVIAEYQALADAVHKQGALLSVGTDLSALTVLKPPGEWGADVAFGNSQRFGIPMGFGGPHAAFFSVKESLKRRLPGRLVGVSKDRRGKRALRLALQTREQHIRREKATSNVCTSQALLANMAVMYAIYYGPETLRQMQLLYTKYAQMIQEAATAYGFECQLGSSELGGRVFSDTVVVKLPSRAIRETAIDKLAAFKIGATADGYTGVLFAMSEFFSPRLFFQIVQVLRTCSQLDNPNNASQVAGRIWQESNKRSLDDVWETIPESMRRQSSYMTHPVFNSHHSETEMLRYMNHLQSKDLSLVHSMIPLGSCTMKLNATTQMKLIGEPRLGMAHPHYPMSEVKGLRHMFDDLSDCLAKITGMDRTCLQPNSGAQGEYAGLRAIRKYHESQPGMKRDICLIPVSAHGTNPASAAMAGMRVVPIKCDTLTGNLDIADLEAKCEQYEDELGAIMITYPSTFGVFEPQVKQVCDLVHKHGGLVYMDGANMNAQIGITSPGSIGADVCHLNLHKTFCIPHGGGGPGVGPICVKEFLWEFVPSQPGQKPVTTSPWGSASILPISWSYIKMLGNEGLRKATEVALLNANYLLTKLKDHYPILHTNTAGRCAHEFIIDARPFQKTAGVEAIDIAKRLQDYGFHAPTMSWPVANTLMIEPTESESKEELDRFISAMVSIRQEIREVEEGKQPREGNVLKLSPHPQADLILGDAEGKWERPYSREKAAYPLPYLKEKKFWPTVARVDDTYGDTNLFCTCPPVVDTTQDID